VFLFQAASGKKDRGLRTSIITINVMGLRSAAQGLGTAQGALDGQCKHAKQREQFGRKLSQFQVIRHKLADMAVRIEGARWLTYKSAIEFDQGGCNPGLC